MTTVERTGLVEAPLASVWNALADFGSISAWAPNVDHSCLMSDRTDGVGMARRIQTERSTLVETVVTWEPGVTVSYAITGLPTIITSLTNTWRIGSSGDSTMVLLTTDIRTGPRPPQQLVAKAVGRRLASASEQMISGLKNWVETQARGATP